MTIDEIASVDYHVLMMTNATQTTKTFKNTKFAGRDYEVTNVIACQGETAPSDAWVECDESVLAGLTQLWVEGGRRYFGHL